MKKRILVTSGIILANAIFIPTASAHCPLCTIGAGAAALGAAWLGFSSFSIGVFLGAAALAMGLWIGRLITKKVKLIPHQTTILGILSFLTTVLPLEPLLFDNSSIYISIMGDYGSWLNRTYYVDKFLVGSVLGAIALFAAPYLSKALSKARNNKMFPYQGMIITFGLLMVTAITYELFK